MKICGTPWAACRTIYGAMGRSVGRVCLAQCAITPQLADVSCFFGAMARSVGRVCLAQCAITPQLADVSCFFGAMARCDEDIAPYMIAASPTKSNNKTTKSRLLLTADGFCFRKGCQGIFFLGGRFFEKVLDKLKIIGYNNK
ncbi:MAG: hypothetical protein FWG70_09835 [Oscillospiraceae bacterium]|nr:hypothetical protein [Oscillospiraceae bacterium]